MDRFAAPLDLFKPFGFRSGEGFPLDFVPFGTIIDEDEYEFIELEDLIKLKKLIINSQIAEK